MTRRSLRLRLALAGAASVGLALLLAFFGLSLLFERHVERRVVDELVVHLDQVIAGLGRRDGAVIDVVRPPADPRFETPLSGLYWQIDTPQGQRFSRSLWDTSLAVPRQTAVGVQQLHLEKADGSDLIAVSRNIVTDARLGNLPVTATVAVDRSIIDTATWAFRKDLLPYLALLALLLFAASVAQIVVGTKPLDELRRRIARIRSGEADRLGSGFPDEVQPLTAEVDGLLQYREEQLLRARERAAELAHGFKTPLQILAGDVERLKTLGQHDMAGDIGSVIKAMRRLVDHEMARARIAGSGHRATSDLKKVIASVVAVVQRTPTGQMMAWIVDVPENLKVKIDPDDLAELIGNLTENAARYGRREVSVWATASGTLVEIDIRDDGPGIPEEQLPYVLRRGGRLDTTSGGAGLGLSISESIVLSARGSIRLKNLGPGLAVSIALPRAQ
ncbi:sensor histidine kinase [Pararhizobium arenae]|uniref:sensor histidine kinase n=1 Tax=Pararhizobium arenae TaxID=1856850 RepID=UPI00094B330D|nr:HAMP domain-containing sensor histidine kinase [Pararhizobium arenae]